MNNLTQEEMDEAMTSYEQHKIEGIYTDAREEYRVELLQMINTELSWKTQDEGFIAGLQWVKDKLSGVDRI